MPTSQNGYPANDESILTIVDVPGSGVRLRVRKGVVAEVFAYLAAKIDDLVEDIDAAGSYREDPAPTGVSSAGPSAVFDDWSYAERPVRGSAATLSNHASGTAVDFNATQHPLGVSGTWTSSQVARVRDILIDLRDPVTGRCVIRWGNDYNGRPDGMHFEINEPESAVARVAARIRGLDPTGGFGDMALSEADKETMRAIVENRFQMYEDDFAIAAAEAVARQLVATPYAEEPRSMGGLIAYGRRDAARAAEAAEAVLAKLDTIEIRLTALEGK